MYLPAKKMLKISFLLFIATIFFSDRTIHSPNAAMMMACPQSPNMTAKRKGNVMIVYSPGRNTYACVFRFEMIYRMGRLPEIVCSQIRLISTMLVCTIRIIGKTEAGGPSCIYHEYFQNTATTLHTAANNNRYI